MRTSQPDLERYERAVIGAVLVDNSLLDDLGLTPGDFSTSKRKVLYRAIQDIAESGNRATIITVANKIGTGEDVLPELQSYLDISAEAEQAAGAVKKESRLRRLEILAPMITEAITRKEPQEIIDMIHREVEAIDGADTLAIKTTEELMPAVIDYLGTLVDSKGFLLGITTGFFGLDKSLSGFQRGEYIVIAARTSIGKTELIVSMMIAEVKNGIRVGVFSAEMSATRILLRMLCSAGGINYANVREGRLHVADFSRIEDAGKLLREARIFLDDTPGIAFSELRAKARKMVRHGAQILYVDYLTLIRSGEARTPRHERIGELSKGFQRLARELDVPVVVLSQLNREGEGKKPTLDMLRQSGEIEEDADVVLFLHRNRNDPNTDLIVAKSRDGGNCLVKLRFLPDRSRYVERSDESE